MPKKPSAKTPVAMGDRFGAVKLTPEGNEPLLKSGPTTRSVNAAHATLLDSLASPCMPLTLRLVSATALRAARKGLTSNPMCEISLVVDTGSALMARQSAWSQSGETDGTRRSSLSQSQGRGHSRSMRTSSNVFRTPVVRSSLNPIWNFDVDFGDIDVTAIVGVLFVVRHVEKMGMVKRELGQVLVSMRELAELRTEDTPERTFALQASDANQADEGLRQCGAITLQFNSYGLARRTDATMVESMVGANSASVSKTMPSFALDVTHEDDFMLSTRRSSGTHNAQEEVRELKACHQSHPRAGEIWFAIDAQWVGKWLLFVSKHRCQEEFNPGPIDNKTLLVDDPRDGCFHLRHDLQAKTDFRLINTASWKFFHTHYGGGPAIRVTVPPACVNTSKWMAELQLHQVAQIGSSYLSSACSLDE